VPRREDIILAGRARAIDFPPTPDALVITEPGTSAADSLPLAVANGGAPVGVAAHPRQRSGLPVTVAPVSAPLSTGTGAAVTPASAV
jgi:hypothetical protein